MFKSSTHKIYLGFFHLPLKQWAFCSPGNRLEPSLSEQVGVLSPDMKVDLPRPNESPQALAYRGSLRIQILQIAIGIDNQDSSTRLEYPAHLGDDLGGIFRCLVLHCEAGKH